MASILFTLGSGVLLLNCPFLRSEPSHSSCCPRDVPAKCPLSKNFDTCPYVMTEAKIGFAENKSDAVMPVVDSLGARDAMPGATDERPFSRTPSQAGLHVLIRVFRI
jgi:hypothetical protein